MKREEEMERMLNAYLSAVAAQLPADRAEDIIAELKDDILTRREVAEEAKGGPLSEDEFEALLRDVGHPLIVAQNYLAGPKGITGAELYPWWQFATRIALEAVVVISLISAVIALIFRDLGPADVLQNLIGRLISGGLTVIGAITAVAWYLERQPKKPAFLSQWRVSDLSMFEWSLLGQGNRLAQFLRNGSLSREARPKTPTKGGHDGFSPVAGAAASAICTMVVLAWWMGVFGPFHLVRTTQGLDSGYVQLFIQTYDLIYWPVAMIMVARIVFDALRVVLNSPVRFTAGGDVVFSLINLGLFGWFWAYSPLSQHVRAESLMDLAMKMNATAWRTEPLPSLLTGIVIFCVVCELFNLVGAIKRLLTGYDRRQPQVRPGMA